MLKVSPLSYSTLLLGLASIVLAYFTAIPALLTGYLVLRNPTASAKDKRVAVGGMFVGVFFTAVIVAACFFGNKVVEEDREDRPVPSRHHYDRPAEASRKGPPFWVPPLQTATMNEGR